MSKLFFPSRIEKILLIYWWFIAIISSIYIIFHLVTFRLSFEKFLVSDIKNVVVFLALILTIFEILYFSRYIYKSEVNSYEYLLSIVAIAIIQFLMKNYFSLLLCLIIVTQLFFVKDKKKTMNKTGVVWLLLLVLLSFFIIVIKNSIYK